MRRQATRFDVARWRRPVAVAKPVVARSLPPSIWHRRAGRRLLASDTMAMGK